MTATPNSDLAARARQLAGQAGPGSLDRRAYGCAAVALSTTGTITAAGKVLAVVENPGVRAAALAALDQLTRTEASP